METRETEIPMKNPRLPSRKSVRHRHRYRCSRRRPDCWGRNERAKVALVPAPRRAEPLLAVAKPAAQVAEMAAVAASRTDHVDAFHWELT